MTFSLNSGHILASLQSEYSIAVELKEPGTAPPHSGGPMERLRLSGHITSGHGKKLRLFL
jgi:hypothetical protein